MDLTPDEAAEVILIAHQRQDYKGCVCGWAELGKSHPGHQVAMLREAALIARRSDKPICTCPDCDVTTFSDKPSSRTVKGLDPSCPVHGSGTTEGED